MPYRTPDPRFPRIVGIDAPCRPHSPLTAADALVVMLSCEPTDAWRELFRTEFARGEAGGQLRVAQFDGSRLLLYGDVGDPRGLAKDVRRLVEQVSRLRQGQRIE